jgi:hypothetical protein
VDALVAPARGGNVAVAVRVHRVAVPQQARQRALGFGRAVAFARLRTPFIPYALTYYSAY